MYCLSIIIPTYKRPLLLNRALQSIYIQDTESVQVIVIDDCNDCSAFDVVKNYPANYYAKRNINKGLGNSRNTGINLSLGKYLIFLDDDDYFTENAIKIFNEKISTGQDFMFFDFSTINNNEITASDLSKVTKNHLLISNYIPVGAYLISRNALKHDFDTKISSHEDWNFLLDNILDLPFVHYSEQVVVIDKNNNTISSHQALTRGRWWLDFLSIYARFPAPDLSNARHLQLKSLGIDISEELLKHGQYKKE
jgi:glycosyltransferase involved in cell wall biosynthesis